MSNVLSIKGLTKNFGNVEVLKGLDLSVPEGAVFGFIGENGAGKTTAMKIVLGLLERGEGEVIVCGEQARYGKTAAGVGFLPDVPEFYPYMKPMEYLTLCGEISGMKKREIKSRGEELLKLVGLSKAKRKIGGFSRGMKQRLGIAQALLNRPKLLICDEPTSALDPAGRKEILQILDSLKEQTTVIFSTHILSDVERVCDYAAFLHGGKIVLNGALSEIKKRQTDSYSITFSQSSDALRFKAALGGNDCRIDENGGNSVKVKNEDGGKIIALLSANNLVPLKFELLEHNLEDLYLKIVGGAGKCS
ncbi:MAG: ABC transporter ATP-binding protein [Oscillospiraceae bacterium]|nr:ABC transporter ATP-binding protein [Oscillospiraceae bacterium]